MELGHTVEPFIKNLLRMKNLDNHTILKLHDNTLIDQLEKFVKSEEYMNRIADGVVHQILKEHFGTFARTPSIKFTFSFMEKHLIQRIIKLSKEKDDEFWLHPIKNSSESSLKRPCDGIDTLVKINESNSIGVHSDVRRLYRQIDNVSRNYQYNSQKSDKSSHGSSFISAMLQSLENNSKVNKENRRYEKTLQMLAAYIYMLGGRCLYEFMAGNFPVPSVRTVESYVQESPPIYEGEFRSKELKKILEVKNLTRTVFISEDETVLVPKVMYDSRVNELVGFVLPTDGNSMLISHQFKATSMRKMQDIFRDNKRSTHLHVYMAQPIQADAPSFCFTHVWHGW
ncbi:hypothetical protein QAD02_012672 [Eretmocerus hayati]|uniref:Uncharacterized protein n=1 Tax=Eretmocerus hayati TaxID=131215 RepID=A0ACC2P019_9HYME|nr:hypothetical protein QAD02_012672 [Eretmocerus hayati]